MGNGGDTEVSVAIVALIVSLIALVVTINQLVAQLAGTADGYRRCAASVIDVWHVKRKRVFKWSEFRFETQYVTPQVVLLTPREFQDYEYEYGEVYLLNGPKLKDPVCKELNHTVHQEYGHFGKRRDRQRSRAPKATRRIANNNATDIEKGQTPQTQPLAIAVARPKTQSRPAIRSESDPLVSWLRLLRELHQVAYSYWPGDCTKCTAEWNKVDTGLDQTNYDALKPDDSEDEEFDDDNSTVENTSRSDMAVIYRRWTWDFMPPDMVRPLAEVSVGDIVILAIRMGMQWRSLVSQSPVLSPVVLVNELS